MIDLINKIVLHMCYRCHEYEDAHGIEYNCDNCLLSEVIDEIKFINDNSHEEWIKHEIEDTCRWVECSECHKEYPNIEMNFCPNCGKRMIGNKKKEENNDAHKVPLYVYASWDRSEE